MHECYDLTFRIKPFYTNSSYLLRTRYLKAMVLLTPSKNMKPKEVQRECKHYKSIWTNLLFEIKKNNMFLTEVYMRFSESIIDIHSHIHCL